MNLGKLILKDYLSYTKAEVDFTNMGKVLIVGMNNGDPSDSNGAGKTNLFEAIGWNGWGESKVDTIDLNVKDGADLCSVEHRFEHDGKQASIVRTRNRKNGSSTLDLTIDGVVSNGTSVTDTNKKISEFLSLDYDTFVNSVYIRQDDVYSLANSKSTSAGRDLLEKILNLGIYEKYFLKVKDKIKDIDFRRLALAEYIEAHKDAEEEIARILELQQARRDEIESLKEDLGNKELALSNAESLYESLKQSEFEFNSLSGNVETLRVSLNSATETLNDLRSKAINFKQEQDRKATEISNKINGEAELALEKENIEQELLSSRQKSVKLSELQEKYDAALGKKIAQDEIINAPNQDIYKRDLQIENLKKELEALDSRIQNPVIKDGDTCDHCLTVLDESNLSHYKEVLKGKIVPLEDRLASLIEENITARNLQNEAGVKRQEFIDEIELYHREMAEIRLTFQPEELLGLKLKSVQGKLDEMDQLRAELVSIQSGSALNDWRDTVKNKKQDVVNKEKELAQAESRLNSIDIDQNAVDLVKTNIADLKKEIDLIKFNTFDHIKNIELLEKDRNDFDIIIKQRKEKGKSLQLLDEDWAVYLDLQAAFSPKGIRSYILETAIEELEKEANLILGRLSSNRLSIAFKTKKEIKKSKQEKLTFEVLINDGQKTFPFTSYSGGQKFRISFVLRVALSKLLLRRAHSKLEFLIIDEAVSPLDGRGVEQIIEVINELQNEFKTILVITHRNDVKQYFEKILTVNMTPDGSVLEN